MSESCATETTPPARNHRSERTALAASADCEIAFTGGSAATYTSTESFARNRATCTAIESTVNSTGFTHFTGICDTTSAKSAWNSAGIDAVANVGWPVNVKIKPLSYVHLV